LRHRDPAGELWRGDTDACCDLRKVEPLAEALGGFAAWISGRKRFHGGEREAVPLVEIADGRLKLNPLADWPAERLRDYAARHRLPPHPLASRSYTSVGCTHCTTPTLPGESPRAGRWRGSEKTECGIHRPAVTALPQKRNRTGAIG
jgi:phosphoadenosine phosphosulfate reductase